MKKQMIANYIFGALMGVLSYVVDIHTLMLTISTLFDIALNYYLVGEFNFAKFEKNGFWHFFIALFVVWTVLYNIRFYSVIPLFR